MWKKEDKLIRDLLLNSFGAFFLSMLTSSLGTLVDGLVIGNVMDTQCVAAFGLVNPLNFIFALIGSILGSGMSNGCARMLSADAIRRPLPYPVRKRGSRSPSDPCPRRASF